MSASTELAPGTVVPDLMEGNLRERTAIFQTIRDTLKNLKEQLLKAAYLATVRDEAKVTNYLARQVIEAAGRLPEAAKTSFPSKQGTPQN